MGGALERADEEKMLEINLRGEKRRKKRGSREERREERGGKTEKHEGEQSGGKRKRKCNFKKHE